MNTTAKFEVDALKSCENINIFVILSTLEQDNVIISTQRPQLSLSSHNLFLSFTLAKTFQIVLHTFLKCFPPI